MLRIESIEPGGTADQLGLKPGDRLDSINGREIRDVIDYRFLVSDERIRLAFHTKEGKRRSLALDKDPDDNLGLEFAPFPVRRCKNNCIFCFVSQMPPECRKSLYVKDDDYRASFLYGNYITLGALASEDWERIFSQRLSPLYISVHATDAALRSSLLRNRKAPDILESMKRLAAGGIRMHTQIVLCPGINDGPHLLKTVEDLSLLFPAVSSIAVVPVGLTAFRSGLFPLRTFTRREAADVIDRVAVLGRRFKRQFGTRLVYASDEFYVKAGVPTPSPTFYEDFPQIENGVGMVTTFLHEVSRSRLPKKVLPLRATAVTGMSFGAVLKKVLERINLIDGVRIRTIAVQNGFFGPSVTVAGLLTGRDILGALKGKRLGDLVLVPDNSLREQDDIFLDGMTLQELAQALGVEVMKVHGFNDLIRLLRGERRNAF